MTDHEPTLTIRLTPDQMRKLQEYAAQLGITLDELAGAAIMALLNDQDMAFQQALDYVLQKNAELYGRLG